VEYEYLEKKPDVTFILSTILGSSGTESDIATNTFS
jgi:hypothetical protein